MAKVPDTSTFTMLDVVNVVGDYDNLVSLFYYAIDEDFDSNYKGSKNSLLNFRNYYSLYTDDSEFSWTATGVTYESTTVYLHTNPFSIYSYPDWITVQVYDGVNEITNPSQFFGEMELRLTPSVNGGYSARNGSVIIMGPGGGEWEILVYQSGSPLPPTVGVLVVDQGGFTVEDLSGSIDVNTRYLTFSFTNVSGWRDFANREDMPFYIVDQNSTVVYDYDYTGLDRVYDDPTEVWGTTVQINRDAVSGDNFYVMLGLEV